jgi:hypothetical protein
MSLQRGINFRSLAEKMGNCSGAEVRGICTEAGMSFSPLHLPILYSLVLRKEQRSRRDGKLITRNVRLKRKTSIRRTGRL